MATAAIRAILKAYSTRTDLKLLQRSSLHKSVFHGRDQLLSNFLGHLGISIFSEV